ncbi:hypothetical protein SUGI_0565810 [Cryptomeria japonica]|uniref:protein STICHEL-like 3 n=1 Tax=Cryptomeria japonica TaxID=3369 RepID=UPI002408946B|nr:protein STICHEL-like 3 [Cryptomeria japonica]XP_057860853.2 protein STICHEL-like 3 [Cryptomeria japonica]GLJ28707.1 hypothetical protein SUGI_0565810 [Cryptomeria japonica]
MTIASSGISKVLSERDHSIQDHVRNHAHLTNFIHLKNHMHMDKSKAMLDKQFSGESSLMKDLITLRRSRSLRDPSTSPSLNSPIMGSVMKKLQKESAINLNNLQGIKPSVGDHRKEPRRAVSASPLSQSDTSRQTASVFAGYGVKDSVEDDRRLRRRRKLIANALADSRLRNRDLKSRGRRKGWNDEKWRSDSELARKPKVSNLNRKGLPLRDVKKDVVQKEIEVGSAIGNRDNLTPQFHLHVSASGVKKSKKYKLKRIKRPHFHSPKQGQHHDTPCLSDALDSVGHRRISTIDYSDSHKSAVQTGNEKSAVGNAPKKGCGIPWKWSKIHDRGKSILDMAGRSLSCGLSDSATRKLEGLDSQSHSSSHHEPSTALETSDASSLSYDSDSESLPLLIEPSASQQSADTDAQGGKFSGELDLYADHQVHVRQNNDIDSETRSTGNIRHGRNRKGGGSSKYEERNQSLSQKYAPKTFRELVGQNLITQALINAVVKGKIAPIYVFHGPHGTGKTSCARIFSAAMNCHSMDQSHPCGQCHSCLAQSLGRNSHVREIGGIGTLGYDCFQSSLNNVAMHPQLSRYRVFIIDDCDILSSDEWNALYKVLDEVPWNTVFILITSKLDHIPHAILSRCQKYLFPKLKETDIVSKLQMIALREDLEIDNEVLNLIASRSNGSMRDAEMTLDQLSLLGQRISLSLVQELVGLIPDEKLVDLLDLALSADTVNTVKSLRELMEAGVEPLALMSQLATLITDILAGSYKLHKERHKRMFFHKHTLSKEEMNRLRQALRTLSEAEKQLLLSNDRTTWLTAALLQLAPDPSHKFRSSSSGTSAIQSPVAYAMEKEKVGREVIGVLWNNLEKHSKSIQYAKGSPMFESGGSGMRERIPTKISREFNLSNHAGNVAKTQSLEIAGGRKDIASSEHSENVILHGKVDQMEFHKKQHKTRPVDFISSCSQQYQSTASCPIGVQNNFSPSNKGTGPVGVVLALDQSVNSGATQKVAFDPNQSRLQLGASTIVAENNSVVRIQASEKETCQSHNEDSSSENVRPEFVYSSIQAAGCGQHVIPRAHSDEHMENTWEQEAHSSSLCTPLDGHSCSEAYTREQLHSQSMLKSKSSRGSAIEQSQKSTDGLNQNFQSNNLYGSSEQNSRGEQGTDILTFISKEGESIAEKIEEENLRLESKSRGLLCWKTPKVNSGKSMKSKNQTRRPRFFQKLVPCAKQRP